MFGRVSIGLYGTEGSWNMSAVRHYSFDKPGDQVTEKVRVSYSDRNQSYAASASFKIVNVPGGRYYSYIIATKKRLLSAR